MTEKNSFGNKILKHLSEININKITITDKITNIQKITNTHKIRNIIHIFSPAIESFWFFFKRARKRTRNKERGNNKYQKYQSYFNKKISNTTFHENSASFNNDILKIVNFTQKISGHIYKNISKSSSSKKYCKFICD